MIPRKTRSTMVLAVLITAAISAAACGATDPAEESSDGKITVVASTNVWGSIAQSIGGPEVEVKSIIADGSADPHSYESTPQDAAAISEADLVVYNGGGYDSFVDRILGATGSQKPTVQAMRVSAQHTAHEDEGHAGHGQADHDQQPPPHGEDGHTHRGGNEHIWYDLHATHKVASTVARKLSEIKPAAKPTFDANAKRMTDDIEALEHKVNELGHSNHGTKVLATEPIAARLILQARFTDITPPEYVSAIESENDPPAAAVAKIKELVARKEPAVMIYNPQTESRATKQILTDVQQRGIPVVRLTETIPDQQGYVQWMTEQLNALRQALPH